jgi:hypothetical protein
MTAVLMFTVREPVDVVSQRCHQAISLLGAPLKSDSGRYITGVISSGPNNVEVRVTWLVDPEGTQITVSASHEDVPEAELENVTQRFKYQYSHLSAVKPKSLFRANMSSILVLAGALAVIAIFVFALINHKS